MLNKFNSGHNREAKSLYKRISVRVPRLFRIPESGEITTLSSFRKAVFLPFTIVVNGLATIVATQSLQLGTVSTNSAIRCCFSITFLVVVAVATIFVVFLIWIFSKISDSDVSHKDDVILRNFKNLKYQNIPAFTV